MKTNLTLMHMRSIIHTYCEQIYLDTLVTTQNCTKMLKNVIFVVQISNFCIRPNKRREKQRRSFFAF